MSFKLYVWVQAFGLPSFDAECIAAIAYLNFTLEESNWTIIESYDASISPTGSFPLLHHEASWIGGFSAIVAYLASIDITSTLLDSKQKAHQTAILAHITATAPLLVSAHLYSSPATYSTTTYPAIAAHLPSSQTLTIPATLRARANVLASAAGLGSASATESPPAPTDQNNAQDLADAQLASNTSPSLIFQRRQTLRTVLKKEESALRFRVEGAVEEFVGPLMKALTNERRDRDEGQENHDTKTRYLVPGTTSATAADCLAYGYLALLIYPQVPASESFLGDTLRTKYPSIIDYVSRMHDLVYASHGDGSDRDQSGLAWRMMNLRYRAAAKRNYETVAGSIKSGWRGIRGAFRHVVHSTLREHGLVPQRVILTHTDRSDTDVTSTMSTTSPHTLSLLPLPTTTKILLTTTLTIPLVTLTLYTLQTQWLYYTLRNLGLPTHWLPTSMESSLWSVFGLRAGSVFGWKGFGGGERDKVFVVDPGGARDGGGKEEGGPNDNGLRYAADVDVDVNDNVTAGIGGNAQNVLGALFRD